MELLLDFLRTNASGMRHLWPFILVLVALIGVLLTGLIVAVELEAVSHAFRETRGVSGPIVP
jgi:hypothetical protein